MKRRRIFLAVLGLLGFTMTTAEAHGPRWSVGVNIGGPGYYYRPWRPYCFDYYGPYPYYGPPPVIVQPAPVYQPVQVIQPAPTSPPVYQAPPPTRMPPLATTTSNSVEGDSLLQQLGDADEGVRLNAVSQLGRMKARSAVDPLAATLAGDRSPVVREAAARALGLIGSPQALPALQKAAQADAEHDVRHSAQFAMDVIQSR